MSNEGLVGVNPSAPPYSNGPYTWDQALTLTNGLTITGNTAFTGNHVQTGDFTVTGTFTFGDAATDSLDVKGVILFSGTRGTSTAGTLVSTGTTWIDHATAGQCAFKLLCSTSATSGDYATMRIRARADAVSSGGVEGINVSASTTIANYTNLCAGYFAVQPNAINTTAASGIANAIHAVLDRTGTSSGRTWVSWIDTHQQTKSGAGDYLERFSHNGTVANDGMITIYCADRMPVLLNFETDSLLSGSMLSAASGTATITHKIACTIAGVGTVYIPLASGIA